MFSFMILSLIIVYIFLIKCKEAPLFFCFIFNKNRLRRPDSVIFGWITWLLFKLRVYSWMTVGPISRLSLPVTVAVRLSVPSVCPSRGRLPTSWGAFRDRQTMNAARPLSSSSNSPVVPLILSASPATSNRLLLSDVCVCEATPSRSRYLTVSELWERLRWNSMALLFHVTPTQSGVCCPEPRAGECPLLSVK